MLKFLLAIILLVFGYNSRKYLEKQNKKREEMFAK
jgi:hypothetical protein